MIGTDSMTSEGIALATDLNPLRQAWLWFKTAVTNPGTAAGQLRLIVAVALVGVLAYWTYRRFAGGGSDPTIRYQSESQAGATSFLVSGVHSILFVATVAGLLFVPEIMAGQTVILVGLAGFVFIHWYYEKSEVA